MNELLKRWSGRHVVDLTSAELQHIGILDVIALLVTQSDKRNQLIEA